VLLAGIRTPHDANYPFISDRHELNENTKITGSFRLLLRRFNLDNSTLTGGHSNRSRHRSEGTKKGHPEGRLARAWQP